MVLDNVGRADLALGNEQFRRCVQVAAVKHGKYILGRPPLSGSASAEEKAQRAAESVSGKSWVFVHRDESLVDALSLATVSHPTFDESSGLADFTDAAVSTALQDTFTLLV